MSAARHTIHIADEDVATLLRAVQSHMAVLHAVSDVMHDLKADATFTNHEADRLSHVSSLVQMHQKGCTCPSIVGGSN